ncbi:MAG TPA: ABC-type transport auxiliary lipoprotein family protein [Terriglobales bacterium]|nr:ABC-type transport auxiliary lipoprotein family protein [Terriglobales bacterium]
MPGSGKMKQAVILPLIFFLNGCTLGLAETAASRTYFLNPEISWKKPPAFSQRLADSVLLITQPKTQPGFDTPRMAYLPRPHEVAYFAFNQWADTPARMLQRVLVKNLDKTDLWSAVLQTPGAAPAQYRLDSDNLVLEQQFFSRPSLVRLALRAQLIDVRKQTVLGTRNFEAIEIAPSDDPYGGVVAANLATAKLITELGQWLSMVMKHPG